MLINKRRLKIVSFSLMSLKKDSMSLCFHELIGTQIIIEKTLYKYVINCGVDFFSWCNAIVN